MDHDGSRVIQFADSTIGAGQMDFAADFSAPLAMRVIAAVMGIPPEDWPRFKRWNDKILGLTFSRSGGDQAQQAIRDFNNVTNEMSLYLARGSPSGENRRKAIC